eukprot:gnl/MRDRNA2_/MRDRNA2_140962_c0_seq1.p1 gnl/MRDRNA2_/MRDRNA2_140962_c0~~gnl/MRDRNA2_/MRDRNA2_140962_c0_seq1.p1  ORF type:complete len:130 (+),score=28.77 gnl/MRDRNA2_/MRDRNA2_140962_c0_seq1:851-1240(+)
MSANSIVEDEMATLVGCGAERKCVKTVAVLPSHKKKDEKTSQKIGNNERLFIELAVCASAANIYLPKGVPAMKITNDQNPKFVQEKIDYDSLEPPAMIVDGITTSTLSLTIEWMTTLPFIQDLRSMASM